LPSVAEVIVVCIGGCCASEGVADCGKELATIEVTLPEDSFKLELVTFPSSLVRLTKPVPAVIIATGESALVVLVQVKEMMKTISEN
jgi:hypothetical protein